MMSVLVFLPFDWKEKRLDNGWHSLNPVWITDSVYYVHYLHIKVYCSLCFGSTSESCGRPQRSGCTDSILLVLFHRKYLWVSSCDLNKQASSQALLSSLWFIGWVVALAESVGLIFELQSLV